MKDIFQVHYQPTPFADLTTPDIHQDTYSKATLGFWLYLMTDCLIFGVLFATYAVFHDSTFGGPSSRELYRLDLAFAETMVLLFSSVTCGMAVLSAVNFKKQQTLIWLIVTFLLGAAFLTMEITEFTHLIHGGNIWSRSAFLSAFFTLVGTHGTHISVGLLWILVMIGQVAYMGINIFSFRRLVIFSMFWHFLDLIWIFIFTFVYLLGVI